MSREQKFPPNQGYIDKEHMFAFLWAIIKNILDKISSDHVRNIFDMQTLIWFVELSEILK